MQTMNSQMGLLMWGMKVFREEERGTFDPAKWREQLAAAQSAEVGGDDKLDPGHGGPGYVAAICIR